MTAMQEHIYVDARVQTMPESAVCGSPSMFRLLDLHTVQKADLVFTTPWRSVLSADVEILDGFLVWFDIFFATHRGEDVAPPDATAQQWSGNGVDRVAFTTGPFSQETHWRQVLLLNQRRAETQKLCKDSSISGEISYSIPEENARALAVQVKWSEQPGDKNCTQSWALR